VWLAAGPNPCKEGLVPRFDAPVRKGPPSEICVPLPPCGLEGERCCTEGAACAAPFVTLTCVEEACRACGEQGLMPCGDGVLLLRFCLARFSCEPVEDAYADFLFVCWHGCCDEHPKLARHIQW
jgi:hypothetical protein